MVGGYKRRLSSTSIVGTRTRPSPDKNPVEEIVDEEWVEQKPGPSTSNRRYLDAGRDAPTVLAKRHIVRFRGSSRDSQQATTPEQRAIDVGSVDSIERHVTFEEEQNRGRYSLEVEDSVTGSRHSSRRTKDDADDDDYDDHDDRRGSRSRSKEPGRRRSKDCCEVPMDNCQHHHHHHRSASSSRQPPVIIVEPHTDESTHCEHCQFFSGWFCCIPFIVFVLLSLLVVYLCFRQRIHRMLDDWQHNSMSADEELYWPTEPMKLEPATGTTSGFKPDEKEDDGLLRFRGFG